MKRLIVILCLLITLPVFSSDFAPGKVIKKVDAHAVAIAVYYSMGEEEYNRRYSARLGHNVTYQVAFLGQKDNPIKHVAYVGAGTVLKDNHVITVAHLFAKGANTFGFQAFVFLKDTDVFYEADLIVKSAMVRNEDDYAVIKTRKDMGLPGITVSRTAPEMGDKVIYVGSTQGTAFNRRFGFLSSNQQFFYRGSEDGALHLGYWEMFEYYMLTNGGSGDSGGGIFNTSGELVGIMYCGMNKAYSPVFANPIEMLWGFLNTARMGWIGTGKRTKKSVEWKQGQPPKVITGKRAKDEKRKDH